jgi:glycosyltransferase involved in cell wall biosynthesis
VREVLIDVTRLLDRRLRGRLPTGIDRVSLAYVKHFSGRASALVRYAGKWIEFSRSESERVFEILLSPSGNFNLLIRRMVARAFFGSAGRHHTSPRFLFNTGHSGLETTDYVRRLKRSGLRPLFFVHDLIPLSHPEYCRAGESELHRKRIHTVLGSGQGVIANSASTLEALADYAKSNRYAMPPSVVALLASPDLPAPDANASLSKPYFLMLGTIEPRKNHWLVLQLWRRLVEQMGDAAPRLVIVGQRGWKCENVLDLLERCETLKGFVVEYQACTDAELATLLRHTRALLFPSFAEGYGMPLVEALALGVPVIASNLPVFREIAGDIPEYIDPLDGRRWGEVIAEYALPSSQLRQQQCDKVAGFVAPSWEDHFGHVEALMEQLSFAAA